MIVVGEPPAASLGQSGDIAIEEPVGLEWVKEGSVWVPQTDDVKLIVPAADRHCWYDAAAKVLGSAPDVDTLTDLFGSNDVTQGTAAAKPHFDATGGSLSRPTVDFDGTDDYLSKTSAVSIGTANIDGYVLLRVNAWADDDTVLVLYSGTQVVKVSTRTVADRWQLYSDVLGGSISNTDGASAGVWSLLRVRRTVSGSNVDYGISGNNGTEVTGSAAGSPESISQLFIASIETPGNYIAASFATVILASALSLGQRIALTRVINRGRGLSFPEPAA